MVIKDHPPPPYTPQSPPSSPTATAPAANAAQHRRYPHRVRSLKMKDSTVRYVGYALVTAFAFGEFIMSCIGTAKRFAVGFYITLPLSLITIAAMIVLMIFNNRPNSSLFLTKLWFHASTVAVFAQAWIPMIILHTVDAAVGCGSRNRYYGGRQRNGVVYWNRWGWEPMMCSLPIVSGVFAYLVVALLSALFIFTLLRGQKHTFRVNVAETDLVGPIHLPPGSPRVSVSNGPGTDEERQALIGGEGVQED
ncbi:hypothetical protein EIP91_009126, partial [Steccherinum ochraceum]